MLVALQRGADGAEPSGPAADLVPLLRSWGPGPGHLAGLALVGVSVPGPRRVDALVFTPYGLVVLEAGLAGWPLGERAGAGAVAAQAVLAPFGGGRFVTGIVVVPPGTAPDAPPGVAAVPADALRRIIRQHNRWRQVWSADAVLDACYALSLAHLAPPRAALLADGFPAFVPEARRLTATVPAEAAPPEPAAVAEEPELPRLPRAGVVVFPRPRPIRLVPWRLLVVLTLLVALGVVAAVFVAQVFHGA